LVYPPALAAAGICLDRIYFLRPRTPRDLLWGMGESLRCPGVAAVIAAPGRLSRIEARRLQLAAETGGGAGLLLRAAPGQGRLPPHYAAATRWVVQPAPGDPTVQRWKIRLVHCHGGNLDQTIILEHCRETNSVRAISELADRSARPKIAGA
jgi:protein ImuA